MALVRRSSVLGQAGQMVAAAMTQTAQSAIGRAQVPGQQEEPAGAVAAVSSGPVSAGVGSEAAAVPSQPASFAAILSAFVLVAAGGFASFLLWRSGLNTTPLQMVDATSVFGSLVVFATAVERVIEPFSRWLPGRGTKAALELAIAEMANRQHGGNSQADLDAVARAKARVEKARANRMLVTWGIATAGASIASTAGGFYLLRALSGPQQWDGVPLWVDAIVTGIVVGSGTKPVHDVIARAQRNKERAEDPAA